MARSWPRGSSGSWIGERLYCSPCSTSLPQQYGRSCLCGKWEKMWDGAQRLEILVLARKQNTLNFFSSLGCVFYREAFTPQIMAALLELDENFGFLEVSLGWTPRLFLQA